MAEGGGTPAGMTFERRPTSVPPDIRPEWRVPLLLLMVRHCRSQRASREQLHVLNSAILSDTTRRALVAALSGRLAPFVPLVQFEPALDRALDRCLGLGLLSLNNQGRFVLTDLGQSVAGVLDLDSGLFVRERELLEALPKQLSQSAIQHVLAERRIA